MIDSQVTVFDTERASIGNWKHTKFRTRDGQVIYVVLDKEGYVVMIEISNKKGSD